MTASAVVVHYHAPSLAAAAVQSLRDDARRMALDLEVLVVDNGSTPDERRQLESLDARLIEPGANRGFAAGVNAGVAASHGDLLLLANGDVEVGSGCLPALSGALGAGFAVVGPRFFLDRERRWLQPPADRRAFVAELAAVVARAGLATRTVRRAWRRRAHRFWSTEEPMPLAQLSGALLAFHRNTWDRVGGFDERYRLYFEESDWLMRVAAAGLRAGLEPRARALHLWAQSARREPRAAAWFEDSAKRFRRRWYGAPGAVLLERLSRVLGRRERPLASPGEPLADHPSAAWIELSATPEGFPAAGFAAGGAAAAPPLPRHFEAGVYHLRGVGANGGDRWHRPVAQNRSLSPIV